MRFKKYSNDWIKYKITDLGEMRRGKSKHRPRDDEMLYGGVYPFIQTGDIKKGNYETIHLIYMYTAGIGFSGLRQYLQEI